MNVFNAYFFKNSDTIFFRFSDSEVSITDSIFNENNGGIIMSVENNSQAFVKESIFYGNKYWLSLILIDDFFFGEINALTMVSCKFTKNTNEHSRYGEIIHAPNRKVTIYDTIFDNNYNGANVSEGDFKNCIFTNNFATYGAVIRSSFGSLHFTNCSFSNNTASFHGGVLAVTYSNVVLIKCTVVNNSASQEVGAISLLQYSSLRMENSVFENNLCGVEGGAIRAHRISIMNIYNSTFKNNKALGADGGAIFLESDSRLVTDNCQFIGNTAALGGGAVMVVDHSSYTETGSTFTSNIAADNGELIHC